MVCRHFVSDTVEVHSLPEMLRNDQFTFQIKPAKGEISPDSWTYSDLLMLGKPYCWELLGPVLDLMSYGTDENGWIDGSNQSERRVRRMRIGKYENSLRGVSHHVPFGMCTKALSGRISE